jgi:hypothetical protein
MRSKHLLAITLLLPFLATSSVASAGQIYGHWQKKTRLPATVSKCPGWAADPRPIPDFEALHLSRWAKDRHLVLLVMR